MQKRSHKLLASTLLEKEAGFRARRYEWAFLFGSFQPDCNPLSYLKGSIRAQRFAGHNYANSKPFIQRRIARLQNQKHWNIWHYYTLGKLTHYLADAFTFPHNDHYNDTMLAHHQYETELRAYLENYLKTAAPQEELPADDLTGTLESLHDFYMHSKADMQTDARYIWEATGLLMAGCLPAAA